MRIAIPRIACLAIVALGLAISSERAVSQALPYLLNPQPRGAWAYVGGDGSSMDEAIILQGARNEVAVAGAEDSWIARYRPGWGVMERMAFKEGCKTYDRFRLLGPDGAPADLYFERGGCYWRLDPVPE